MTTELTDHEKLERINLLQRKLKRQEELPFLYGWKWYPWARKFYDSTNKTNLLCAANQISKSSTQIRKVINWATNKELWAELWNTTPKVFWYFYPTAQQASVEWESKWSEFMPNGSMKDDPRYGWRAVIKNKEIYAVYFNSGVTVYFKSYSQKASALQTTTVHAIFCDEEIPLDLYDELFMRTASTRGYFNMVFTATLGQEWLRRALEPSPHEKEELAGAFKLQVSMYDCLEYEDGTKSHWTKEDIELIKQKCKSEAEVLRRVYGRFIMDSGRKYPTFEASRHIKPAHKVPNTWPIYVGIDSGSGGKRNHPAAICFVSCNPEYTKGRVFMGWRGDNEETTSSDVLERLQLLKELHNINPVAQFYDHADRDFQIIAGRVGEPVTPADKKREKGEGIVNTLFKNDMLCLYDDPEIQKLTSELLTLRVDEPKERAHDDFIDALRYAVSSIPWNWEQGIKLIKKQTDKEKPLTGDQIEDKRRRGEKYYFKEESDRIEDEFEEWNDLYGT